MNQWKVSARLHQFVSLVYRRWVVRLLQKSTFSHNGLKSENFHCQQFQSIWIFVITVLQRANKSRFELHVWVSVSVCLCVWLFSVQNRGWREFLRASLPKILCPCRFLQRLILHNLHVNCLETNSPLINARPFQELCLTPLLGTHPCFPLFIISTHTPNRWHTSLLTVYHVLYGRFTSFCFESIENSAVRVLAIS